MDFKGNVYVEEIDGRRVYLTVERDGVEVMVDIDGNTLIGLIQDKIEALEEDI